MNYNKLYTRSDSYCISYSKGRYEGVWSRKCNIQPPPVSNIDTNNNNYYFCSSIVKKQALLKPPSLSNACSYFWIWSSTVSIISKIAWGVNIMVALLIIYFSWSNAHFIYYLSYLTVVQVSPEALESPSTCSCCCSPAMKNCHPVPEDSVQVERELHQWKESHAVN